MSAEEVTRPTGVVRSVGGIRYSLVTTGKVSLANHPVSSQLLCQADRIR